MARLITSITILVAVVASALLWGDAVLHLGDEVAEQVHGDVDWTDPESVALARYNEAFGLTLEPLARIYKAAAAPDTPIDPAGTRDALAAARAMAEAAAQEAPETLAPLEPLFADYLDKAGALLTNWDPEQLPTALLAETFEAQHALNDALQDAQEARLLRDIKRHEADRGYAYHHRLIHYQAYRTLRVATGALVTAGALRQALADYFAAEVVLQDFLETRSRIHDEFLPFSEAAADLATAMSAVVAAVEGAPDAQWTPELDTAAVVGAFGELRAHRRRLLRLERAGEL